MMIGVVNYFQLKLKISQIDNHLKSVSFLTDSAQITDFTLQFT